MDVAIALGILISEITHDAFKHMVMTFESEPSWHVLESSMNIVQKVQSLENAPWGGSTNFEKAFELILNVVRTKKLSRQDMPSLIVFSDMQFDESASANYQYGQYNGSCKYMATMHQNIVEEVAKVGEELGWDDYTPNPIVYWNLRNTGGHPVDKGAEGAVLLSGFSPSMLKVVMQGTFMEETEVEDLQADGTTATKKLRVTPEQVLSKVLADEMYDPGKQIIGESTEGKLQCVGVVPRPEGNGEKEDDFVEVE